MNNILGHLPKQEVNLMILNSRWKDLSEYFQEESCERFCDIEDLLSNLSKKMDHNMYKENKNNIIISTEINKMSEDIISGRKVLNNCENYQAQYITEQNEKNSQFIRDQIIKRDKLVQTKIIDSDFTLTDLSRQFHDAEQKSLTQAEELYREFQTSKKVLRTQLEEGKKDHMQMIQQIYEGADFQFDQMLQYMKEYQDNKRDQGQKIGYMLQELNSQLQQVMEYEQKSGCIVYDCLLSSIEDSYSKIHERLTLK